MVICQLSSATDSRPSAPPEISTPTLQLLSIKRATTTIAHTIPPPSHHLNLNVMSRTPPRSIQKQALFPATRTGTAHDHVVVLSITGKFRLIPIDTWSSLIAAHQTPQLPALAVDDLNTYPQVKQKIWSEYTTKCQEYIQGTSNTELNLLCVISAFVPASLFALKGLASMFPPELELDIHHVNGIVNPAMEQICILSHVPTSIAQKLCCIMANPAFHDTDGLGLLYHTFRYTVHARSKPHLPAPKYVRTTGARRIDRLSLLAAAYEQVYSARRPNSAKFLRNVRYPNIHTSAGILEEDLDMIISAWDKFAFDNPVYRLISMQHYCDMWTQEHTEVGNPADLSGIAEMVLNSKRSKVMCVKLMIKRDIFIDQMRAAVPNPMNAPLLTPNAAPPQCELPEHTTEPQSRKETTKLVTAVKKESAKGEMRTSAKKDITKTKTNEKHSKISKIRNSGGDGGVASRTGSRALQDK
ncbi:hypothetical protein HYALB_00005036 [Hymenoscyphus albidus]|uniref:Uncharacterized protein n=1 Tax=Hymenoscyphus albidus TaxID=595503 RepID=A0A9N9LE08_9HELO|nr:hypothetical protein HYALB_00005036 [Hymenoscyphus albidus]